LLKKYIFSYFPIIPLDLHAKSVYIEVAALFLMLNLFQKYNIMIIL